VGGGSINGWECAKSDGDEMRKVNEPAKKNEASTLLNNETWDGGDGEINLESCVGNGDGGVVRTG